MEPQARPDGRRLTSEGKPRGPRRGAWRALAVAVVVATAAVGPAAPAAHAAARAEDATPKTWDRRVAPIAARVSKLRGLSFEHAVPVRYLSDAAFRKRVGVKASKLTGAGRREVAALSQTLRALGLIDAHTNLVESLDTVSEAGVIAFYDPEAGDIVIRGKGPLDVDRKATLAHELTHVLQDQHFDLQKLRHAASVSDTSSGGALDALIEGDAERIKDGYLQGLPQADRDAYDAAQSKTEDAVGQQIASTSELVKIEFSAPYALGPLVLKLLVAEGGNRAVDRALRQRVVNDTILVDPASALHATRRGLRSPARRPRRARTGSGSPTRSARSTCSCCSRAGSTRQTALDGADAWGGDRIVTYRSHGAVCARGTIVSPTADGARTLGAALRAWAATMPKASVTTDAARRRTTLTSCDTGAIPPPSSLRLQQGLQLLASRSTLLDTLVGEHVPVAVGECVSRRMVKVPVVAQNLDRDTVPPEVVRQIQSHAVALVGECRRSTG